MNELMNEYLIVAETFGNSLKIRNERLITIFSKFLYRFHFLENIFKLFILSQPIFMVFFMTRKGNFKEDDI